MMVWFRYLHACSSTVLKPPVTVVVCDCMQVCVAAVDEAKCQPINSWRDEDQEVGKVCCRLLRDYYSVQFTMCFYTLHILQLTVYSA